MLWPMGDRDDLTVDVGDEGLSKRRAKLALAFSLAAMLLCMAVLLLLTLLG